MAKILVIDDESSIRNALKDILEPEGYKVDVAEDGEEGLSKLGKGKFDVAICDVRMPKLDGIAALTQAREQNIATPFIMISGNADMDTAIEATRLGAFDFLEKPPDMNRLFVSIRNALDKSTLESETRVLKRKVYKTRDIIGDSDAIARIKADIDKVAPTDARVLITGPNGSGKELVARWIHEKSERGKGPLVEVNCAAIPPELIESELFGHEKGSFTGALKQRIGKFEQANGGVLFMDEVGDMSLSAQAKVLRALQEHKITRVGGDKDIKVDVRVVAATNKNLQQEIEDKNFREDLYHRLGVVLIHVPPLKERRSDIPLLTKSFIEEISQESGKPVKAITDEALAELVKLEWRGNVRELRNVVERLLIFSGEQITGQDVLDYAVSGSFRSSDGAPGFFTRFQKLDEFLKFAEEEFIRQKLNIHQRDVAKTAKEIGLAEAELNAKLDAMR